MKKWFKFKTAKSFLKFLAIPIFFGTIVASVSYGLPNGVGGNSLLSNQNAIAPHAESNNAADQPTINDVVNGDVSSLSQPITNASGNYILPTLTTSGVPGLIKANSFVAAMYGINFSNFNGYHVRQIVQNYNDQDQYFILLVNDSAVMTATVTSSPTAIDFNVTNPAHVLAVSDTGSNFTITEDHELGAPILDQTMIAYYAGIYFQPPLSPEQEQTYNRINRSNVSSTGYTTSNLNGYWGDYNFTDPWLDLNNSSSLGISTRTLRTNMLPSFTIKSTTTLKKINEIWDGYTQNVATFLYLNSLNNMVFVSNKTNNSGSDAIYLFGGNKAVNLWFYTFSVNQSTDSSSIDEPATGWVNYRVFFQPIGNALSAADSSDIVTQKAYNFNLNITHTNFNAESSWNNTPYRNASFFGYYVAGAKYVDKPSGQIQLELTIPNYALFRANQLVIFTGNVHVNGSNKYGQPPQSRLLNLYASLSTNNAIQTTQYRNQQIAQAGSSWSTSDDWIPRYSNINYNFLEIQSRDNGVLSYAVSATANDGYKSQMYNKIVAYVPEVIGNDSIALKYSRDEMTAIILSREGQPSYRTQLSLYQSNTKMDDLTNISFSGNTWFLTYKAKTAAKSTIYSFNYDSTIGLSFFSQTNLELDGNFDVLNILPLNSQFIYVLAKDNTDSKVVPLLYRLTPGVAGNYQEDVSFNNLVTNDEVAKVEGVPAYAVNGTQNADQRAIWGTVNFRNIDYLSNAGFLSNPASVLADDPASVNTIVEYTPGWDGQDIKITASSNENNQLQIQVSIQYFNGLYYSPQQLSAQNTLTQVYGGFSALPNWVLPVSIAVPILFLAIFIALGLGLGIPMAKTRKLQDKGFSTTFKKVDTLTSAVGSVYKKIISQTAAVKKKPQMLKASGSSVKKVSPIKTDKPVASAAPQKPATINKPTAPSPLKTNNSPTKPVASPIKPPINKIPNK